MQGPILSRTCRWEMAAFPETDRLPQKRSLGGECSNCNRAGTDFRPSKTSKRASWVPRPVAY